MIVVFGSLNIDMVMHMDHLPCAGETLLCKSHICLPGGKGANQAVVSSLCGSKTYMCGSVGRDGFGEMILNSLKKVSVDVTCVKVLHIPTGCAFVCVDKKGENFITVSSGANKSCKASQVPDKVITSGAIILMQMEVPLDENWKLLQRASEKGARTVLNLAPIHSVPLEVLRKISILTLNRLEAFELLKILRVPPCDCKDIAFNISKILGNICILTLGKHGAFASNGKKTWKVTALNITPVDTTGAGDAFTGALCAALDRGDYLPEALSFASAVGGLVCLEMGAQPSSLKIETIQQHLKTISVTSI